MAEEKKSHHPSSSHTTSGSVTREAGDTPLMPTAKPKQATTPLPSTFPMIRIVKAQIPSELLKKLERDHIHHVLVDALITDLDLQSVPPDQRHAIGRTDSAFYVDLLPEVLKPYASGGNHVTISSSKLLQRVFAEEFRENAGWATAKILYANAMFRESLQTDISVGESEATVKDAEREKLKVFVEIIAQSIFGHPVSLKQSPLPRRLIETLIYADQRLHEALLTGKNTARWSTEQMRDARCSVIKQLAVTRLLMPMMSALAGKSPSQKEIWCLGLAMQVLQKSALVLSKEVLAESFAASSSALQRLAMEKETSERILERTRALKSKAKQPVRHVRSRSADTTPVDIDWLRIREEVRSKRALEKKDLALQKTKSILSAVALDDDAYEKVIIETGRALQENDEIRKAETLIKEFSVEEIEQIQRMLDERDEQDMMDRPPEGEMTADRTQPLPTSTADPVPGVDSRTSVRDDVRTEKEKT